MNIKLLLLLPLGSLAAQQLGGGLGGLPGLGGLGSSGGSGGLGGLGDLPGLGGSGGLGGLGGLFGGSPMKPESVKTLKPQLRPTAKRTLARWGPYKMVAHNASKPFGTLPSMDPHGQAFLSTWQGGICHDCTILGGVIGVQTQNGSNAIDSGMYIHHILSFDNQKKTKPFASRCATPDGKPATSGIGSVIDNLGNLLDTQFVGVGEDNGNGMKLYNSEASKIRTGFRTGANDELVAAIDLVNYSDTEQDVFVTLDIEYVDGKEGFDSYSTLMDIGGCTLSPIKTDPNGPVNTTSGKFPVLNDGIIVSAKGHLHTGGVAMVLSINDQEACVSQASYKTPAAAAISGMSQCEDATPVKRGDYLSFTAIYDLKLHPGTDKSGGDDSGMGGMGGMGGMDMGDGRMGGSPMGMFDIVFAPGATAPAS